MSFTYSQRGFQVFLPNKLSLSWFFVVVVVVALKFLQLPITSRKNESDLKAYL